MGIDEKEEGSIKGNHEGRGECKYGGMKNNEEDGID
jgi:hypothetical protein